MSPRQGVEENRFEDAAWAMLEWRDPSRACGVFDAVAGQTGLQRGRRDKLSIFRRHGLEGYA